MLTFMFKLLGRKSVCKTFAGSNEILRMADPIFGSKYGPQNGVQNWITFSFLLLGLCLGPVLGSRFGPKSGASHRKILLLPADVLQADLRRTSMSVSVNTCFFSLCVPICFLYSTHAARNFTLRLAEKLAQYICSLTRRAESLATPETECLLYATYWFRPILSELIGAAMESADVNRERAPSGPVKVVVTNRPHSRRHNGVDLVSGVSALLAWFPASWASKIAPCFIGEEGGSIQLPQEVAIVCPHREFEGLQRDAVDQVLQAVKFTDKNAPGLSLALDEEFQAGNCFTELIRGYTMGAVEPYTMMGLQPTGPTRVNLEVIVPSPTGLTPAKWKQTATLCPLDWPSNYSLLRLWHTTKSFHQYAAQLKQQMQHRHMFTHWEVNRTKLASRVLFQRPAHYVSEAMLRQHGQERVFPDRRLRRKTQETDRVAFQAKCNELRLLAAGEERTNPVSFAIGNSWNDTLRADKQHYLEYTTRSLTYRPSPSFSSSLGFVVALPFSLLCPPSLGATLRFAPTCCGVVGVLLRASVGFCPLVAPLLFYMVGWCGAVLTWAVFFLPSCVLGLVFCFLSCVAPFWLCFCCVGVSACAVVGVFPWSSCSFLRVVGPPFVCRLFGCCRLPSPAGCCFPSPCGWSLVASWSSFYAGPSLWVSGCFL